MQNKIAIFLLVCLLVAPSESRPSSEPGNGPLHLFTCRSLYIAGESIRFAAIFRQGALDSIHDRILYAELLSPDGRSFAASKYIIPEEGISGLLKIPENLLTGWYYLRVYTRTMRNQGPAAYASVRFRIVNPLKNDLLSLSLPAAPPPKVPDDNELPEVWAHLVTETDTVQHTTHCRLSFSPDRRDDVYFVAVSVVPAGFAPEWRNVVPVSTDSSGGVKFDPDVSGLSFSGWVKSNGKPIQGNKVLLALSCHGRDLMATETDSTGRFRFLLPVDDVCTDLYLLAQPSGLNDIRIETDPEFCSQKIQYPAYPFRLEEKEKETVLRMAVRYRLEKYFRPVVPAQPELPAGEGSPFYGIPSQVLNFSQFVALPELEEYFNELPSQAKVRRIEGKRSLRVLGENSALSYMEPLVLLDYVPVFNIDKLLSIPPSSVNRLEIVNVPYTKGDIHWGGIVSLITQQNDFAGYDFPLSGKFLKIVMPENHPMRSIPDTNHLEIPDTRNTLFWRLYSSPLPAVGLSFSFEAPAEEGPYEIRVMGMKTDGGLFSVGFPYEPHTKK